MRVPVQIAPGLALIGALALAACQDGPGPAAPGLAPAAPSASTSTTPVNGLLLSENTWSDEHPDVSGDWVVWHAAPPQTDAAGVERVIRILNVVTDELITINIEKGEMGYDDRDPVLQHPKIDGDYVIFSVTGTDIGLYDLAHRELSILYRGFARGAQISGTRVVWFEEGGGSGNFDIFMIDVTDPGTRHRITDHPGAETNPDISGDWVVWQDNRNATLDIYARNIVTGEERLLTDDNAHDKLPSISGTRVAWQYTTSNNQTDLYVHDLATGQTVPVVATVHTQAEPDIDGDLVVWTDSRTTTSSSEIFLCNLATGEEAQLTDVAFVQFMPAVGGNRAVWADQREDPEGNRDTDIYMSEGYNPTGTCEVVISEPEPEPEPENAAPSADAGGPYAGDEGSAIGFDGSGSSDPDGDALDYAWHFGDPALADGGAATGATPTHTYADDGEFTVTLTVSDGQASSDPAVAPVTVDNVAPTVGAVAGPVDPVAVNTAVEVAADFTDPGVLDTHAAEVDWGDGTIGSATVQEAGGSGSVSAAHTYTAAGVYTVTVTVVDDDGGIDAERFEYVVVYDPDAGFVTGGGWIDSPPGAYAADPALSGRAIFGFTSRYKTGATTPSGDTKFRFKVADLDFRSTVYEWLVVSGPKARYKGSGTINGVGDYGFLLTANDGDVPGGGEVDAFRIKIWDRDTGEVIYDNQIDQADDADASGKLGGGTIVIHAR